MTFATSSRYRLVAGLIGCLFFVVGCSNDADPSDSSQPDQNESGAAQSQPAPTVDLDVLVFNVEYRGGPATDKVIRKIDADVVGVLESYERLPEIAANTGYKYYDVGLQLLSKYPIHEPSGADGLYALIEVEPGYVVAMFNTHLDYVKYGPKLLAKGVPVAKVMASENEVRTASIQKQIPKMTDLLEQDYPVVLTGDLNEPSSLDYVAETVGAHPGATRAVPWPVSEALLGIGLRDTFRETYPDPTVVRGDTWGVPGLRKGGQGDRIDYVYAGGPVRTIDTQLVGEPGGENVDIPFKPWTSDHRAVVSSLKATLAPLPTTVSLTSRMLADGEDLTVYVNAPSEESLTLVVYPTGGDISTPSLGTADVHSGDHVSIKTDTLEPGGYEISLIDPSGEVWASNEFWLRSKRADVDISTAKSEYAVGEPIEINWDNGPANRWDWIGVFRAKADNPDKDPYLLWGYTGGHDSGALPPTVAGSMTLNQDSQGKPWPLPPGKYVARYLLADEFQSAGMVPFTVKKR